MNRRWLLTLACAAGLLTSPMGFAQADEAPDAFIKRLSVDVLDTIKADKAIQAGDIGKITQLRASDALGALPRPSSKNAWKQSSKPC
jgi:phospholipid transport system substrate-binding protein